MGGAGVAAGNDSALPYLNPAGLAGVPSDIFGISASLFAYQRRSLDVVFYPNGFPDSFGPVRVEQEEIASTRTFELPGSVMYFKRLTPEGAKIQALGGVALAIPEVQRFTLKANLDARLTSVDGRLLEDVAISREYTAYYVGPSYAMSIDSRVRLGASLFARYSYSSELDSSSRFLTLGNNAATSDNTQSYARKREALALAPILGAQFNVWESLWLGVSVAVPTVGLWGQVNGGTTVSDATTDPNDFTRATLFKRDTYFQADEFRDDRPLQMRLGVAWDDRDATSFALDGAFRLARKDAIFTSGTNRSVQFETGDIVRDLSQKIEGGREVAQGVEVHGGVETALSGLLSLRAGAFYIDPLFLAEEQGQYEVWEREMGGSFGLGVRAGSFDTTIGLSWTHTSGDFATIDPLSGAVETEPTASDTLFLVISGSVTAEEAKATMDNALPVNTPGLGVGGKQ